ncbi:DsbA family protein [Patescibacteria group bacterium]|nr:DsbA family protein [Patescibacteria group bacterium]MBU4452975.1 DsbA family protein [Patescibacteria group bacterium]
MRLKYIIIGTIILFTCVFIFMIFAISGGNSIELTNIPLLGDEAIGPVINKNDPVIGAENPSVTIFSFGDFANSTSTTLALSLNDMLKKYPNDIAIIWKDYPNSSLKPEAMPSAIAARCAQKQDEFWAFHDYLIKNSDILSKDLYLEIAKELNLWQWSFNRCISKEKTLSWVEDDVAEAIELSIPTSPTIFINGARYSGYISKQELEQLIISAKQNYE